MGQASGRTRRSLVVRSRRLAGRTLAVRVFDWTSQDYFSPQALAYLLFVVWLAVLVHVVVRRAGELTPRTTILLLGLFSLIVVTHVLTSLEVLGVLAAMTAAGLLRRRTMILTCGLIFIVWQLNVAGPFFAFYADRLQNTLLDVTDFVQVNLASRVTGSPQHAQIAELRILVTGTLFALAGLAVLVRLVQSGRSRPVAFGIAFLFGIAFVAPASVYGGEMLIRVLLFCLPLLAGLAVAAFGTRAYRLLLVAVIIVMAPIHILTHYGNELHDYVSPGEVAGFEFVELLASASQHLWWPSRRRLREHGAARRPEQLPVTRRPGVQPRGLPRSDPPPRLESQGLADIHPVEPRRCRRDGALPGPPGVRLRGQVGPRPRPGIHAGVRQSRHDDLPLATKCRA